jgi:hypothetical protein
MNALFNAIPYSNRNVGDAGAPAVEGADVRLFRALVWAVVSLSFSRLVTFFVTKSTMSGRFAAGLAYACGGTVTGAAMAVEAARVAADDDDDDAAAVGAAAGVPVAPLACPQAPALHKQGVTISVASAQWRRFITGETPGSVPPL